MLERTSDGLLCSEGMQESAHSVTSCHRATGNSRVACPRIPLVSLDVPPVLSNEERTRGFPPQSLRYPPASVHNATPLLRLRGTSHFIHSSTIGGCDSDAEQPATRIARAKKMVKAMKIRVPRSSGFRCSDAPCSVVGAGEVRLPTQVIALHAQSTSMRDQSSVDWELMNPCLGSRPAFVFSEGYVANVGLRFTLDV